MDLNPTPEQKMLRDAAQKYFRAEYRFDAHAKRLASADAAAAGAAPIVVRNTMYVVTPFCRLIALDPETGMLYVYSHTLLRVLSMAAGRRLIYASDTLAQAMLEKWLKHPGYDGHFRDNNVQHLGARTGEHVGERDAVRPGQGDLRQGQ